MTGTARRRALVAAIHDTDTRLVLAVAGGGNAAITDLLDVAGASRTVLEIVVPYAERALLDLLADGPGAEAADTGRLDPGRSLTAGAVSRTTAEAMAAACLRRAYRLTDQSIDPVIGVACTAALVSDRPKRGDHRAHIAVASTGAITHRHVVLTKGDLDRIGEDRVVADAVLEIIAGACGVDPRITATMGER